MCLSSDHLNSASSQRVLEIRCEKSQHRARACRTISASQQQIVMRCPTLESSSTKHLVMTAWLGLGFGLRLLLSLLPLGLRLCRRSRLSEVGAQADSMGTSGCVRNVLVGAHAHLYEGGDVTGVNIKIDLLMPFCLSNASSIFVPCNPQWPSAIASATAWGRTASSPARELPPLGSTRWCSY